MTESYLNKGKEHVIDVNEDVESDDDDIEINQVNEDDEIDKNESTTNYFPFTNKDFDKLTSEDVFGMKFVSLESAENFYYTYAKVLGFGVRKDVLKRDKNNIVISRRWVCSKEGHRSSKYLMNSDRQREPRDLTRVGCIAAFRIFRKKQLDEWIVKEFVAEHNHSMVSPCNVQFLRSNRSLKNSDKAQICAMRSVGIKSSSIMDYMVSQCGGHENLGFTKKDLSNYVNISRKEEIQDGDAESTLAYFVAKSEMDPSFYYKFDVDEEHRLKNLFWADSRSRLDFLCFGDVLAFDTTYKTNAYKKPLVILVGVNHHYQTIIFGSALLIDETIETYKWVLETLVEAMYNKRPNSVITDGDKAMHEAIKIVFPEARHRLCSWHLQRNAMTNVKIGNFTDDFNSCMAMRCTPETFEKEWHKLINKYRLKDNQWVEELYLKKSKWAEAYLRGEFFAGMRSTQRCESMNRYLNMFLKTRLRLYELVRQYDRAIARVRHNENKAEYDTRHSEPVLTTHLQILESHASTVFTRSLFYKVRKEIHQEALFSVVESETYENFRVHILSKFRYPESTRKVLYYFNEEIMKCSCLEYETVGIPCRHMFAVMKYENLEKIPIGCIMLRWTKAAKFHLQVESNRLISEDVSCMMRFGALSSMCNQMCYVASQTNQGFSEARNEIAKLTCHIQELNISTTNMEGTSTQLGDSSNTFKGVQDPEIVKTKGSQNNARVRRCKACGLPGHDRRTCKKVNSQPNYQSFNLGEDISNPQDVSNLDSDIYYREHESQFGDDIGSLYHGMSTVQPEDWF